MIIDKIRPNRARFFQLLSDIRAMKIAMGIEMRRKISWRMKIAPAEPLVSRE
jgi:hypothetical protein